MKRARVQLALVGLLGAILVLLAVLQYRWSLAISRAERTRIEAALNTSVAQFRQEFYRELSQLSAAFHNDPGAGPQDFPQIYADRFEEWSRSASRADLLANVYILRDGKLSVYRPAEGNFTAVDWPAALAILRPRLEDEFRQPGGGPPMPGLRAFAWTLEESVPALVRPVFDLSGPRPPDPAFRGAPPRMLLGFVILELSRPALDRMMGELAQRYFSGPDGFIYNVAVVSYPGGEMLYRSDSQLTAASLDPPDARAPLVAGEARPGEARPGDLRAGEPPPERARFGRKGNGRRPFTARARGAVILPAPAGEPWQLVARHKGGSLEAVVAADRRRNLLLSFGVLILLAASMGLIILWGQRARRLAQLQMEFVAGVSHELRTPVAVICSAADNLAEGFVATKDQVKDYGVMLRNEGRRLAAMIEQMLHFAAGQSRPVHYELAPVSVPSAIGSVLATVSALPEAAGFSLERELPQDLPLVRADAPALNRCLENLVMNALKYSGESRWVRVFAVTAGMRVRISVEDGGPGIDPADLPHIFEPFYRGRAAQAAQIHGTGLGLSLARDIAEGMGGRLDVSSELGRGSIFTIDLAAAAPQDQAAAEPLPRTA